VEWNGNRVTLSGEIEMIDRFQRSYRLVRTPLPLIAPVVRHCAAPECRYVVIDDKDRVVLADVALPGDDATFRIDLGGRLPAGQYTMLAVIGGQRQCNEPGYPAHSCSHCIRSMIAWS
jgi:hypothetical protein